MTVYKTYRVPVDTLLENPSLHEQLKAYAVPDKGKGARNNDLDKNDTKVRAMVRDFILKHGRSKADNIFAGLRAEGAPLPVDDDRARASIRRTLSRNTKVFVKFPDESYDVRAKRLRVVA